jgi:hypothetical protein
MQYNAYLLVGGTVVTLTAILLTANAVIPGIIGIPLWCAGVCLIVKSINL